MPRKLIRRWLPEEPIAHDSVMRRWFGPVLDDPNLLHLNRRSVARAFFVGLFCAFLPVPGQTVIAALMALWLRSNLPISLLLLWISNPLTFAPIMVLLYKLGQAVLGNETTAIAFEFTSTWFLNNGTTVYLPMVIGGLISGLCFGGAGYLGIQALWRWKVINNWQERKEQRLLDKQSLGN
jgi:hypothetical protein